MGIDPNIYKSGRTPWGVEVKKRLLERELERNPPYSQKTLLEHLNSKGFSIKKQTLNHMLNGRSLTAREGEVEEINRVLGITM